MAAPVQPPSPKLPDTQEYRVSIGGAMYMEPKLVMGFDGVETVIYVSKLGERGQVIRLTDREAARLKDLDAIKGVKEPLSYEEMTGAQLDAAVKAAGVTVVSSGAESDKPLPADKIAALRTFDQGRGVVADALPIGRA